MFRNYLSIALRNLARHKLFSFINIGGLGLGLACTTFIILFVAAMSAWILWNTRAGAFDPFPFILLNLVLSCLAALQAPVIMMSQNRQDTKDRVRSELDFEVNRRAELEIQGLSRKMHLLDERIDDLTDLLRDRREPAAQHAGE